MHQELIDELLSFARRNDLRFKYDSDDDRKVYHFLFQDQERTWGYCRQVTIDQLDTFAGPTVYFANDIINTLKRKIPTLA